LDQAVRKAYGMSEKEDMLTFLLKLNLVLADKEASGQVVQQPGIPASVTSPSSIISDDRLTH